LIGETGGEAHVGLFTEDVEKAVHKSLIPLMAMLVAIACLGSVSFFFVARTISTPIRSLTAAAEKISLGDIDLPIDVQGRGEIGELAASLERMRFSIKAAMNRMRRN
jgi:HAMP domain-containing protein